ncbi:MAG: GTPase Era [Candidatus Susulua stagnicola]|nr:GTPase Era [Candidatus Susulua stagnicola]
MLKKGFKSGFVTILGRPNAGKSTLLNALIDNKVSIISPIPQTTRHQIKGILNLENAQIVFVDTPGIHSFEDKLAAHLNTVAKRAIEGCDLIIYVVDMSRRPGEEEQELMRIISGQKIKTIMVLNKIDLGIKYFNLYIDLWAERVKGKRNPLVYYIPLSAKTGKDVDKLRDTLLDNLPESHPYYDTKELTDFPIKFRIADIIREKLFLQLKREVPHSVAVEIEEINNKKKIVSIRAVIYVKRNSQKRIVIGKAGEVLKEVGSRSRPEIEKIYNKKVFLDIWVKVLENWQDKPRILKELGYWWE